MGGLRLWSSSLLGLITCLLVLIPTTNGWDAPSPHQYHIQTDEGPERYFRYQTDSGQYRKEKRLEDGTVIGTYAWIDANGILRQRDYIADNAGYRILKTKNVFVGRNVDVGAAVKSVKKLPTTTGTLLKSNQRPIRPVVTVPYSAAIPSTTYLPSSISSTTPETVTSTTARPYVVTTPSSVFNTGAASYVDSSPKTIISSTPGGFIVTSTEVPIVEITPNSYPKQVIISTPNPPLLASSVQNFTHISQNYLPVTTEVPFYQSTSHPSTQYIPSPPTVQYIPAAETGYNVPQIYSKEIDQNSLDYSNPYVQQVDNSYRFHNGPTYPLDRNGRPYNGQNFDYNSRNSQYDGVSVTNDGFRYYIPRAYHEEQTLPGDKRSGSFGYIDPFGIRRVIYYNAAPGTGFQHRKNNRYVGFDATPYDPRY